MGEIKAGVILKTKYCRPGTKLFKKYVSYIDRDEAVRNEHIEEFNTFNDYMGNPAKTEGLFDASRDSMTAEEKAAAKTIFEEAQKNGSLMWQTVISFDNRWLEQNGLMDEKGAINSIKLQEYARKAVSKMYENEKLVNVYWTGAIHHNTDNIHIHVAAVEPVPMRERMPDGNYRGKFKYSSISKAKSSMVSSIIGEQPENTLINNLIRENIVKGLSFDVLHEDAELAALYQKLYESLPDDRRMWRYNMNGIKDQRGQIDGLAEMYLKKYHEEDYKQLKELIEKQDAKYRTAYGTTDRTYTQGKEKDLRTRMGNAILNSIREYDKELRQKRYQEAVLRQETRRRMKQAQFMKRSIRVSEKAVLRGAVAGMKASLKNELQAMLNELEYQKLERAKETSRLQEERSVEK